MPDVFPTSVRYIKNGAGGRWWRAAKANGQVHAGWSDLPQSLLRSDDRTGIANALALRYVDGKRGFKQDLNQLLALLDHPSQHLWVTFEDGCMWWCTVQDGISANPDGETRARGHFWLTCASPWSNKSLGGRELAIGNLPGVITTTQGFRGTLCMPDGSKEILRVIQDEEDLDAVAAAVARVAYECAIARLVARLRDKDFELLVDLILSRSGWARLRKLGGVTEGIDVEVENAATDEIAFVQVKSVATQPVLDDYVSRFNERRGRYQRMIFAVHTLKRPLNPPGDPRVQIWTGEKIAALVVKHGLGDWVASHV